VAPALTEAMLSEQGQVLSWCLSFEKLLQATTASYSVTPYENTETQQFLPSVTWKHHGLSQLVNFTPEFFRSSDYKSMMELAMSLKDLLQADAFVQRGEKKQAVKTFEAALEWLMNEAKRGLSMQRYKGLGEMNPDQLWETTMDPTTRRLLQVTIEDAIAADQIFTCLMGDVVEPRRAFIEDNALNITDLDY